MGLMGIRGPKLLGRRRNLRTVFQVSDPIFQRPTAASPWLSFSSGVVGLLDVYLIEHYSFEVLP
jgi:hypothetical protein